jgi:hypothetical protein
MPNVTTAPVSPLARLKSKLGRPPTPTAEDRVHWHRIAEDRSAVRVTDEAPDVSRAVLGLIECAPPSSFRIDEKTAAWFDSHGGARAVQKALRAFIRDHQDKQPGVRRKDGKLRP